MSDASVTKNRTAMATITFSPSGQTIEVPAGTSLLDAAILCELDVPSPCAGQGRCGRCRVRVTSGEVERRSNAGLATAEILGGWAVACQTYTRGSAEIEVPERRRETVRPQGHALGEPESLPVTCDWRQDPAVRTFELDIEPPSLADNTNDFDRLRRALAQQHGIEEVRAELPMLRRLPAAASDPHLPRRRQPREHGCGRGPRDDLGGRLPPRLRDRARGRLGERLQQADRLRRGRDLADHLHQAQTRPGTPAEPCRRDHQRPAR